MNLYDMVSIIILSFPELPVDSEECPWRVDEEEVRQRRDLRHSHLVFSIDPRGCEDVDDTLSVRWLYQLTLCSMYSVASSPGSILPLEVKICCTSGGRSEPRYEAMYSELVIYVLQLHVYNWILTYIRMPTCILY